MHYSQIKFITAFNDCNLRQIYLRRFEKFVENAIFQTVSQIEMEMDSNSTFNMKTQFSMS
jgi:DNA replication initiation complex subunit (GINS family)